MEKVDAAIEYLNKTMRIFDRSLEFSIHEDTNRIIVRVIDRSSEEVIREIPPERILDLVAALMSIVGFSLISGYRGRSIHEYTCAADLQEIQVSTASEGETDLDGV